MIFKWIFAIFTGELLECFYDIWITSFAKSYSEFQVLRQIQKFDMSEVIDESRF
jgi:hypothetical protein